ncbi:MAG: hypothetical protein CVU89_06520 [Firmicutes bacterium HGW-Firmicutes-14]|nr:MAG: hypothetical protein CVU89_06520 [Firmicutes bacterium HGW-Firmicutes-14]
MGLPLSGSKDRELLKIKTEDLLIVIKGKPIHPTVEQFQLHRNDRGEWEKATLEIVSFNGYYKACVFDPFAGNETDGLSEFKPGTMVFPCFYEQQTYSIQVKSLKGKGLQFYHENKYIRDAITLFTEDIYSGNINFKSDIGFSELQIMSSGRPLLKIKLEVFPSKIDYRRDFQELLKDVNEELYNLAYDFLKRTYFGAKPIPNKMPSLIEFFNIISLIFERLLKSLEIIRINPHHKIIRVDHINCIEKIKRFDYQSAKWLCKHPEVLRPTGNGRGLVIGTQTLVPQTYLPQKLRESKKEITYNTFENRFIKLVLKKISQRLHHFRKEYLKLYSTDNSRFDPEVDKKLCHMSERIRSFSRVEFLKDTADIHQLDNMSLVLQMAPGYRDVYKYYLMLLKGLSIQSDVFHLSVKDLAVLYEYWCFLSLNKLLKKKYQLKKNDLIKVNNRGLVVTLRRDKRASIHYESQKGEKFSLSYQERKNGPTTAQVPDNVLSLRKEGSDISYKYVFDAKYRINPALDENYKRHHKKPGPEEDDINTMHRYRDAIIYEDKAGGFERSVFGAFVLFPYSNEDHYSGRTDGIPHTFYESINQVNIGGLPFLPGHTKLVEEFLDELILDTPETAAEKALVHDGTEEYYYNKFLKKNVFIGSLRTKEQWDINYKLKFYHTPLRNVFRELGNLEYVAVYRRKELFKNDNGIRHYGKIKSFRILPREKITEIKGNNNRLYVRFEIEEWLELPRRIIPLQYGVYDRLFTTLPLLLMAKELPELSMQTEEEVRLWKELRRFVPDMNVSADDEMMDRARLKDINIGLGANIWFEGDFLMAEKSGETRAWPVEDLRRNRIKVFRELREFLQEDTEGTPTDITPQHAKKLPT